MKKILCCRIDEEVLFRLWEVMAIHYPGIKKQNFIQLVLERFLRKATGTRG